MSASPKIVMQVTITPEECPDLHRELSGITSARRRVKRFLKAEALRDLTLIAMGDTSVRFQSLLSGAIEAAILTPPYTVMAEQKGMRNLVWLGDILGDTPSNGLSTSTKKLKERTDQVQRFLRASVRSMKS